MTHHPRRTTIPGPRRLALLTRLKLRRAMLDTGRTQNLTVLTARAANKAAGHRRAELVRQGQGQTPPMSSDRRTDIYMCDDSLSARQLRQLVRMDSRTTGDRSIRDLIADRQNGMTTARGYTAPKGRATPKRPLASPKGVEAGRQVSIETPEGLS